MLSIFAHLVEKHNLLEILRKFSKIFKNFLRKLLKMHYFSIFFKEFNKPCVHFSRIWTKNANCWEILRKLWKFLMKILSKNWIFYFYLENLLLKIEPPEITPFFYNNFFLVSGFNVSPFPLGYALEFYCKQSNLEFTRTLARQN